MIEARALLFGDFQIGNFSDNGAINEVKVYSRALTDLETKKILIALGVLL